MLARPFGPRPSRWLGPAVVLLGVAAASAAPPAATVTPPARFELLLATDGPLPDGVRAEDVAVEVTITAPDGTSRTRPAFWDGGKTWRVRFGSDRTVTDFRTAVTAVPPVAGLTIRASRSASPGLASGWVATPGLPAGVALAPASEGPTRGRPVPRAAVGSSGPTGEAAWSDVVRAGALGSAASDLPTSFPIEADRFVRHGGLTVAGSGTYLAHEDGTPFFLLADTAWNGAIKSTAADWDEYLAARAAQGYTAIQFLVPTPWRAAAADADGRTAFADVDPVTTPTGMSSIAIDPAYYRRMDEKFAAVERHGLLAVPVLIWGLKKEDPGQRLSEADAIKLCRYEVARYGAFPVLWMLAGDNSHAGEQAERFKRIGRAVFGDHPDQPVTSHVTGENWPWKGFKDESWLTVLTYQSGHGDTEKTQKWLATGPVASSWQDFPSRPIFNSEPNYEDHLGYKTKQPFGAFEVRRAAWWSLLAASPTAGVTYGGHGIWSWETVSGTRPKDHEGSGPAKSWREAVHLPGGEQMAVVRGVAESLPWWTLRPAPGRLAAQPGTDAIGDFVACAEATDGSFAVIYSPAGGEVTVSLAGRTLAATAEGGPSPHRIIDPATGAVSPAPVPVGRTSDAGPSTATFDLPKGRDGLLVVLFGPAAE